MIELYISNNRVDLPENTDIRFDRQLTDYTNPTTVRNSYSKTVEIPRTATNDRIFNNIWKLDRTQWSEAYNPSKRVNFKLVQDGNLLETGYVKLDKIKDSNYNISLYGELGNILYRLDTDENTSKKLTLGSLQFDTRLDFTINVKTILAAWNSLKTNSTTGLYSIINFAVTSDGIPEANNFDPGKCWTSTETTGTARKSPVKWGNQKYTELPATRTVDNITYSTVNGYGLLELAQDVTPIQIRDFRSYLLRPVIRIKSLFKGISNYLYDQLGYKLDISDNFFNTAEFIDAWMTLSMLYEVYPDIETGQFIEQEQLLSTTSSPASYLINYCKIYNLKIVVDTASKVIKLVKDFYSNEYKKLEIDLGSDIEISPLSFDKATYTFNYADGTSEFLDKYKKTYDIAYGSKKVNTGYQFSSEEGEYISNSVFRQGLDSVDQSGLFHYNVSPATSQYPISYNYPVAVIAQTNFPIYKLFYKSNDEYKTTEDTMSPENTGNYGNWGYMCKSLNWSGLKSGVYQDTVPRLQLHTEDNRAADGKNILVWFTGFDTATTVELEAYNFKYTGIPVSYLLSDDDSECKGVIGKNCYFDNPSSDKPNLKTITSLPSFTRAKYSWQSTKIVAASRDYSNVERYGATTNIYNWYLNITTDDTGEATVYLNPSLTLKKGHKYLTIARIKLNSYDQYWFDTQGQSIRYPHINSTIAMNLLDSVDMLESTASNWSVLGSIEEATEDQTGALVTPFQAYNSSINCNLDWLINYDLTELGLADTVDTVQKGIAFFKPSKGIPMILESSLDFGTPREIYVPATLVRPGSDIYSRYWYYYLADLYSVDTRILDCTARIDNIEDTFTYFYYYDNAVWVLSSVTDWIDSNRPTKSTFIKVNNTENYLWKK